jgi:Transglycosylase SLT domain
MDNENAVNPQGIDSFLSMGQYTPEQDINALLTPKPQEQQPAPSAQGRSSPYDELFQKAEAKYGLPAGVLSSIGFTESSFNPHAVNKTSGAAGLMGFMDRTAKEYGINPHNPDEAVPAAGKKLAGLRKYYNGDMAKALAGYNAGERKVNNAIRTAGDDWISKLRPETQDYITKILGGGPQQPKLYNIPLASGETLQAPVGMSREEALASARAQGVDAVGLRDIPLATGETLQVPEHLTDEEAIAQATEAHPDLDFTTQAEAELAKKHELIPAFKSGVLQGTGQILQGAGEWSEDINPLKPASDWAKQKGAEYATKAEGMYVPTSDAEASKQGMYGSVHQSFLEPLAQGAGSLAPLAAAYAVPGVGPALGTAAIGLQETGAMANEAEQEGRTFSKAEALPYIAGSTVLNMIGIKNLGPLRNAFSEEFSVGAQQAIKSALEKGGVEEASKVVGSKLGNIAKNVGVTSGAFASGDIGTRVLERIYAGKSIDSDEAFTEYGDILKSDLPLGVVAGGVHGHIARAGKQGALEQAQRDAEAPAVSPQPIQPEVNEQGYTPEQQAAIDAANAQPQPTGEVIAPVSEPSAPEQPTTEQALPTGEAVTPIPEQPTTEQVSVAPTSPIVEDQNVTQTDTGEIEEPTIRQPEQPKAPEVTEAPHWADALGLTPSSAKYKQLKQLDINDTDHHSAIKNILDSAAKTNMKIDPIAVEGLYKQLDAISPEETSKKKLDFGEALGYGWKPQVDREGRINAKLKGVENEPLRNAVHSSDMGQTIDALSQSKNPIIRHLAEASKNLTDLTIKSGVMPGEKKNAGGAYEPAAHLITMNPKYAGNETTVGHELLHANVYHAIENPTQKQKPSVEGLKKLHATVKNHPTLAKEYGLKDVHEFVSEGLTNPEFQYKLKKIKYENTTMWGKFTQSIADMLGLKRDNAFVELLTHTENLLPSEPVRRGKDTKGGKPLYNEQERTDANQIPETTTPNVSRGAQPEVRQKGKGAPISSEGVREGGPETGQAKEEKIGKVSDRYPNATATQKARLDMAPKGATAKIPEIIESARKVDRGEATHAEHQAVIDKYKPVTPYNYVPKPEKMEDMAKALQEKQRPLLNAHLDDGLIVDSRLDIPAYSKGENSAWVPTIHEKGRGAPIAHKSTVILNDVSMHMPEKGALNIAMRKETTLPNGKIRVQDKTPIATMRGAWENHTPEQAYTEATKVMDDYNKGIGDWRQVGMDPDRHGYFYDRETQQPIVGGDRLIQIGPLVLIKNPKRGEKAKEDYLYSEVAPDEPGLGRLRSADILVDRSPKGEELKKQRDKDIEKAQMAVNDQSTLGRTLNKIRSRFIAHDSALDYATREDKTFQANGEFHERILRNQAKERRNFISSAIEHGFVTRSSTGLLTINRSDKLNLVNILDRAHDLPKGFKAEDVERILTVLANEGHQIRYQDIERRAVQRRADAAKLVTFAKTFPKGSLERKSSLATAQEIRKLANSDQRRVDAIKEKGGIGQHITSEMVADAHSVMDSVPEIKAIVDDVHKVMQSLVDLLESTGNIDASVAREWRNPKYQYAPLYMSTDELESIGESNIHISSAVKGIGKVKAKGVSEHRINMFENLQKHYAFAVDAAMENNYKSASLNWLAAHGSARELASNKGSQFQQVVSILRNGKSVMFAIDDPVLFDAFKDIARLELPAFITAPSMVVRKGALVNPMFWYRQLIRDPFMANFTAQTGLVTPFGAARSFLSILTNHNAEYKELVNKGVLQSQSNLADQKLDFIKGKKQRSNIQKGWSFAQHVHEAADAATRVEVYKAALKEAKKIGGLTKEQQNDFAVSRARDFMSFANQGSDASVRMINQSVPFFNSFLNGMDVLLRNATGMNMSKADATRARKIFWTRAMYMTAASMAYSYTLASNSQDYRDAKPDDWMNNWLMPGLGDKRMGKAASPFEIGIAFKLIPEAMVRQLMGLDTGTRSNELLFNAVLNGLTPPLPIPAFAKPILEAVTGKSMFGKNPAEWLDIESPGAKNLVRAERGRGKSYIADAFSDLTGMSPAISQTLLRGYGTEVYSVADMIANGLSRGIGEGLGKDWTETVPYAKAFVTNPNALGDQNEVYSQAEKYSQISKTMTHLLRVGDPRAALYATDENMPALYGSKAEAKVLGAMTKLNQAMAYTENDTSMPIEEKRKQMEELLAMKRTILDMGMGVIKKVEED